MAFDLTIWKENFKQRLPAWKTRLKTTGAKSVYFTVSAAALWPVVEAYKQGDLAALFALGGVLAGLGSNLLANQIQTWHDETDAAEKLSKAVQQQPALRAELDAVLEKLEALSEAESTLSISDRQWFSETLRAELSNLESQITYTATATHQSASVQGGGIAVAGGATYIGGGVQGDYLASGATKIVAPDPRALEEEHFTRARTKYLTRLRRKCQTLPLSPLGDDPSNQPDVSLDDVYIALNTTQAIPLTEEEIETRKKQSGRLVLEKDRLMTASETVLKTPKIVILGDPGSGKSTFIRNWLARQAGVILGENAPIPGLDSDLLPILITLRDLIPRLDNVKFTGLSPERQRVKWVEVILEQLRHDLHDLYHTPEFFRSVQEQLENGRVLLALDGLDELPEPQRAPVRQVVAALLAEYELSHILITCRIRSYTGEAVQPGFASCELAPFNRKQVQDFCLAWYMTQARLGKMVEKVAHEKADNLAGIARGKICTN